MNTFPFDSWEEVGPSAYFTFGEGAAGVLVVLMIAVTIAAFIGWVVVEGRKLEQQASRLRAAGRMPGASGEAPAGGE